MLSDLKNQIQSNATRVLYPTSSISSITLSQFLYFHFTHTFLFQNHQRHDLTSSHFRSKLEEKRWGVRTYAQHFQVLEFSGVPSLWSDS